MTITEDLLVYGVKLRQRQEKAKAEIEAERAEKQREIERRAEEFWNRTGRRKAKVLQWQRKEKAG